LNAGAQPRAGDDWLIEWAGDATLIAAVEAQRLRIRQLAVIYQQRRCSHREHAALPQSLIEFAVARADVLHKRLDVLCRSALLLCGIKKRSTAEAALLLGVSEVAVSSAYCVAIDCLDVMQCEQLREIDEIAAICN
jgi:DNA-directed RNA polymerase specialized sigma24 family protein